MECFLSFQNAIDALVPGCSSLASTYSEYRVPPLSQWRWIDGGGGGGINGVRRMSTAGIRVSSAGAIGLGAATFLARILKPWCGYKHVLRRLSRDRNQCKR